MFEDTHRYYLDSNFAPIRGPDLRKTPQVIRSSFSIIEALTAILLRQVKQPPF